MNPTDPSTQFFTAALAYMLDVKVAPLVLTRDEVKTWARRIVRVEDAKAAPDAVAFSLVPDDPLVVARLAWADLQDTLREIKGRPRNDNEARGLSAARQAYAAALANLTLDDLREFAVNPRGGL